MSAAINENGIEFSKRVQETMAQSLGIPATNYLYKDKIEFAKKIKKE